MLERHNIELRKEFIRSFECYKGDIGRSWVYLDEGASEAFNLTLGPQYLFSYSFDHLSFLDIIFWKLKYPSVDCDVLNISRLEHANKEDAALASFLANKEYPKISIFTTQLLNDAYDPLLKAAKCHPNCSEICIYCAYSIDAHTIENKYNKISSNAYEQFRGEFENEVNEFRHNSKNSEKSVIKEIRMEIRYFPHPYCLVTSSIFVLPQIYSKSNNNEKSKSLGFDFENVFSDFGPVPPQSNLNKSPEAKRNAFLLAHALLGVANHIKVKYDIFTFGSYSELIGHELCNMGVPPCLDGSIPETTASLVLIDRSVDLIAPSSYSDCLVDRIIDGISKSKRKTYKELKKYQGSKLTDFQFPLIPSRHDSMWRFPRGTFFHPESQEWYQLLQHLFVRSSRDGALLVRKWMKETIRREGLVAPSCNVKPNDVQSDELRQYIETIVQQPMVGLKNSIVCDFAASAAEALDSERSFKFDILRKNQSQIQITRNSEDLTQYFLDLIVNASKDNALFGVSDILQLLIYAYAIMGDNKKQPFSFSQQKSIVDALTNCILEGNIDSENWLKELKADIKKMRSYDEDIEPTAIRLQLQYLLSERMDRLKHISTCRSRCKQLHKLINPSDNVYTPLVCQLLSLISVNAQVSDLSHTNSALKSLLKKGLGKFGFQSVVKPGDNSVVVAFVVGGISLEEVKAVSEVIEKEKGLWKPTIFFGGSCFLTTEDTMETIFS